MAGVKREEGEERTRMEGDGVTQRWGEPGIKRTGCSLKRLKCGFSTSEGVQPQNGSTAGAFAAPLRVLSQKNMTGDNVLF